MDLLLECEQGNVYEGIQENWFAGLWPWKWEGQ